MIEVLDGTVVNVEYYNLPFPANEPLGAALVEKYGEPTSIREGRARPGVFSAPIRKRMLEWTLNGATLVFSPWASTAGQGPTRGTVQLIDAMRHDTQWVPREAGRFGPPPGERDL